MSSIPEEICLEILQRVPVKSTYICKCVCKSWFQMISNPDFVKMHLDITLQKKNPSLMFSNYDTGRHCCEIYTIISEFDDAVRNNYPFEALHNDVQLYGTCNGLVYFWSTYNRLFYLWNPATKEYKIIPKSPENYMKYEIYMCGFGYDHKIDDYKVINVVTPCGTKGTCFLDVYTLGKNSWKCCQTVFDGKTPFRQGVLLNGALHWLGKNSGKSKLIFSLDISNEKFNEMEPPKEHLESRSLRSMTVGELDGFLCILVTVTKVQFEVWVMQEYGVGESWTTRYIIDNVEIMKYNYNVKLVWSSMNGEVLLWDGSNLVLYDTKHRSARDLIIHGIHFSNVVNYIESLVSVHSG